MKTRNELAVIAANLSDDVRTIHCSWNTGNMKAPPRDDNKLYTYKAPRDLADQLVKGDLVLVEGPQASPRRVVRVVRIDDECLLDDPTIHYKWAFEKVSDDRLTQLQEWEQAMVDKLYQAQRRRAKRAMLDELGADMVEVPRIAAPTDEKASENDAVVETYPEPDTL